MAGGTTPTNPARLELGKGDVPPSPSARALDANRDALTQPPRELHGVRRLPDAEFRALVVTAPTVSGRGLDWSIEPPAVRDLGRARVTVGELLDRDVAMLNWAGQGERPILATIAGRDVSRRRFLTAAELQAAQHESGIALDEARGLALDMEKLVVDVHALTALWNAVGWTPGGLGHPQYGCSANVVNMLVHHLRREGVDVRLPTTDEYGQIEQGARRRMHEAFRAIVPATLRGFGPPELRPRPREGLGVVDRPAPVLIDNEVFSTNLGFYARTRDGERRLNLVCAHLAAHGIFNDGGPQPDPDQRYFSRADYQPIFELRGESGGFHLPPDAADTLLESAKRELARAICAEMLTICGATADEWTTAEFEIIGLKFRVQPSTEIA